MQKTLKSKVTFDGYGLHSGLPCKMTIHPASAEYGIWFRRMDAVGGDPFIAANWQNAVQVPLCTRIENEDGVHVSTVEHILAALAGCGVYNALIEVSGPEIPIMDGSSVLFVKGIMGAGIQVLAQPVRAIRILSEISVERDGAQASLKPAPTMEIDFSIDFANQNIGRQSKNLKMANGAFVHELCNSRTFCNKSDIDFMHSRGMALGGSLENAVVFDESEVLNPGGLRHTDEPVRHKMLDALGDLALAGAPIIGCYTGHKAGHSLTNDLLRRLFVNADAFEIIECDVPLAETLPGSGLDPRDLAQV